MRKPLLCLIALSLALPAAAQAQPSVPASSQAAPVTPSPGFQARLAQLAGILSGTGDYDQFFTPGFRAQVPKAKFEAVSAQLTGMNGPVIGIEGVDFTTPYSGTVRIGYRDAVVSLRFIVDPDEPHQVSGLLVTGVTGREKTLAEVTGALDALHGTTGYALARLGTGAPQLIKGHNVDRAFAVGSAFKLVILAELVRATNAGERKWDDMATLDGRQLPGGGYTAKPKGTQVSLRELATQMISISDDSATDILLRALGREKVEAMLPVMGVRDAARNRPFLGTLEAFKLKYLEDGALARRYFALDTAGRRRFLDGPLAAIPLVAIPPEPEGGRNPAMIDTVEWFFTPADLVRMMDWLRRNTEGSKGAEARAVLSKNPGVASTAKWEWVGFKGGSEPGVINLTLLLRARNGEWYVLTASWNDTAAAVEEGRFAGLIGRAAELAAPGP